VSEPMQIPRHAFADLRKALAENGVELTNDQLEASLLDFCGPFEFVDMPPPLNQRYKVWFDYALEWITRNRKTST
jgi:hypothetical protein